jgi:hypothetical protein
VVAPNWQFDGRIESARAMPLGFDGRAAATGVRFNGFYLFATFKDVAPQHDARA